MLFINCLSLCSPFFFYGKRTAWTFCKISTFQVPLKEENQVWSDNDKFWVKYAFNVTRICFTFKGKVSSIALPLQRKADVPVVCYTERLLMMCGFSVSPPPQLSPPLSLLLWCRLVHAAFRLRGFLCSRASQVNALHAGANSGMMG